MIPDRLIAGDLTLRRYRIEDAAPVCDAVLESGSDLSRYETWAAPGFSVEEAARYVGWWISGWDDESARYFGVWRADRYLGSCGLSSIDRAHRVAGLGFWVRSSETGRGVATAAAKAVVRFGFEHLELSRIEVMAAVDNEASLRVAAKVGAAREGILRRRLVLGGVATDAVMMAVLRDP